MAAKMSRGQLTNLNVMKIEIDVMRLLLGAIGSIHHHLQIVLEKKGNIKAQSHQVISLI